MLFTPFSRITFPLFLLRKRRSVLAVISPLKDQKSGVRELVRLRIGPFSMLANERDQPRVGLRLRNIVLHAIFADVEIDFSGRAADIPEIRIGHFPRAI